jgi:hypothetical protein
MGRRLRGLVLLGVLASGAVVLPAAAAGPAPTAAATPDPSTTRWSRNRSFQVSYVSEPSPPPLLTVHSWTVTIRDAAGTPVPDARVTVLGGMPAHGHGFPTSPQIKELGGGRYLIEGLKFHMPGAWVVGLRIKAGTTVDSVNFDVQLD